MEGHLGVAALYLTEEIDIHRTPDEDRSGHARLPRHLHRGRALGANSWRLRRVGRHLAEGTPPQSVDCHPRPRARSELAML